MKWEAEEFVSIHFHLWIMLQPEMKTEEKKNLNIISYIYHIYENININALVSSIKSYNAAFQCTKCCCSILIPIPQCSHWSLIQNLMLNYADICCICSLTCASSDPDAAGKEGRLRGWEESRHQLSFYFLTAHEGMKNWYLMDLLI